MRPEPVGFRWYLRSQLPVSWLATEVIPAVRYLRRTERMAVVNARRGWLHGNHLEVIAYSGGDRAVPWAHLLARLRQPAEQLALPPQPHGTFEWVGHDDLRPWPGSAQTLRERALTTMVDSLAETIEAADSDSLGDAMPLEMVAEIMLAASDAHPLRFPHGTSSYRADVQTFLDWSGTARAPRPEFERRLAGDRSALRALVARMLTSEQTRSSASWRRTALYCLVARARAAGLPVTVTVTGAQRPLPPDVDQAAYRIVQEALTNVSRHAGQASARVSLQYTPDALTVQVDDDGTGAGTRPAGTGLGLIGMRERVSALGGRLQAGTTDGGGFQVSAEFPARTP